MLQSKSKKILAYIFLFFIIGTLNNKDLNKIKLKKTNQINVSGLSKEKNFEVLESLDVYKFYNLFFLNKIKIDQLINSYNHIDNYSVFKKYPSSLIVKLSETNYLAYTNQNGKNFYIGSNGKLIEASDKNKILPNIFGDFDLSKFFELKKTIDQSNFDFNNIKNLFYFPSGRWDIEIYSGVLIKLPKNEFKESLNLSFDILNDKSFKDIRIIDVRPKNQIIINE
tara:strand:+ start:341 stop:1012 length:672 start_codon:yes stop_codon:yes gene_type:complete